jgi:hypothetical protein
MATIAPTTTGRIDVVEWGEQKTLPAGAAISAGTGVREDVTTGNWAVALATVASNGAGVHLALRTVASGEALTAMKSGVVGGFTISQAPNSAVYLSDTGTVADAAGTVSIQIGRVVSGTANDLSASHDKNIRIDCPV